MPHEIIKSNSCAAAHPDVEEPLTDSPDKQVKANIFAAGGVLWRPAEDGGTEVAVVHRPRYGDWSFPKGKLDPGEKWKQAALREVMEETGLKSVTLGPKIGKTLHTFHTRGGARILKVTRWYHMTTEHRKFVLQREEDIEDARWLIPQEFLQGDYPMFLNIRHLIEKFIRYKGSLTSTPSS